MFVYDDARDSKLEERETLGSLRREKGKAVLISMTVYHIYTCRMRRR
jgi:hypothetical protein